MLTKRFQITELIAAVTDFIEWNILVKLMKNLFIKKNQSIRKIVKKSISKKNLDIKCEIYIKLKQESIKFRG